MALSEDSISRIESVLTAASLTHFGFSKLKEPLSFEIYESWILANKHGEMNYLKEHLNSKKSPQNIRPGLKSAIVITQDYFPHPQPTSAFPGLKLAYYSKGEDYHHWFQEKLNQVSSELKNLFPEAEFLAYTDSGPILERDLAYQAGLGWIGKNTCLIDRKQGSLFFIGEILTSLDFDTMLQQEPVPDFCGNCNRCIEVCPTKALTKPRELDARLCVSYWNIESRKIPPPEIREKMQDLFFGCDLCQTVCPWNEKVFKFSSLNEKASDLLADLRFLLTASGKQIEKRIQGTPLKRAGPFGLRRNALIVIGNLKIQELKTETQQWIQDPKLADLAKWTLEKLSQDQA